MPQLTDRQWISLTCLLDASRQVLESYAKDGSRDGEFIAVLAYLRRAEQASRKILYEVKS